jgi:hypothetical protein
MAAFTITRCHPPPNKLNPTVDRSFLRYRPGRARVAGSTELAIANGPFRALPRLLQCGFWRLLSGGEPTFAREGVTSLFGRGCVKRGSSSDPSCEIIASWFCRSKWLIKRFIEGENRTQSTLFPESLDEYIALDNAVRVVDAFVNKLDLQSLGFNRAEPSVTGRPGYQPATMLKIYVYGYLNRLQSSRRLERKPSTIGSAPAKRPPKERPIPRPRCISLRPWISYEHIRINLTINWN